MANIYSNFKNNQYTKVTNGRYPTPPSPNSTGNVCFPVDLVNNNRNFYITLQLCTYERGSVFETPFLLPGSSITLPIPLKINDTQTVRWDEASLTSMGSSLLASGVQTAAAMGSSLASAASVVGSVVGAVSPALEYQQGAVINPALVMLFKTQNFKTHNFQWYLAPNNTSDRDSLQNIVSTLKNGMLPTRQYLGAILGYPNIVIPSLSVGDYTYRFKPCAIEQMSVNWSATGPSFFKDLSPTVVSLEMQLKEIELWFSGEV